MKAALMALVLLCMAACQVPEPVPPPPVWNAVAGEQEYTPYLKPGTAALHGQAFFAQKNGTVAKLAGELVTLDPATSVGEEWWSKAGTHWAHRALTHPSPLFLKARRTTTVDLEGTFEFTNLPAGKYYVRTQKTWVTGSELDSLWNPFNNWYYLLYEGGILGELVELRDNTVTKVILSRFPSPNSDVMWWHHSDGYLMTTDTQQLSQALQGIQPGNTALAPAHSNIQPALGSPATGHMTKVACSFCKGTGKDPIPTSVANFGHGDASNRACPVCGKFENHYHKACPSCNGKGTVDKFVP